MSSSPSSPSAKLLQIYNLMYEHFGDRKWWPAESTEEIVIGAILVQNVSWKNVENAINLLKSRGLCSFNRMLHAPTTEVEQCIRSTRFYRTKSKKLYAFAEHLQTQYQGSLQQMFHQEAPKLRTELLNIYGIGPETADDIVLYAAELPTFVVDAYTKRIFSRLSILTEGQDYEEIRSWFLEYLPTDVALFNQYHALLDAVGHHYCLPKHPHCSQCPLQETCAHAQGSTLRETL
ncbi:endonuclease III domain-containing protein [Alicyclobacillus sp. SO9]|uniref:endonuclease III domain-containing protein n=1 Tax=Alicyclobacillus sp. SO9 TaxID=2665646 RepID=UPI0018E83F87|nr:endonuclease [Alicyclobacillus sp. SO9]QQE76942.1 endonuclease [Alicyclobacillus sp. SO9]